jgi:hypothetical protein
MGGSLLSEKKRDAQGRIVVDRPVLRTGERLKVNEVVIPTCPEHGELTFSYRYNYWACSEWDCPSSSKPELADSSGPVVLKGPFKPVFEVIRKGNNTWTESTYLHHEESNVMFDVTGTIDTPLAWNDGGSTGGGNYRVSSIALQLRFFEWVVLENKKVT